MIVSQRCLTRNAMLERTPVSSLAGMLREILRWLEKSISKPPLLFVSVPLHVLSCSFAKYLNSTVIDIVSSFFVCDIADLALAG